MKASKRKANTVTIIPERRHGRPPGTRLITRSTTVRPFVYSLPASEPSQETLSPYSKRSRKNQDQPKTNKHDNSAPVKNSFCTPVKTVSSREKRCVKCSLLNSFNSLPEGSEKGAAEIDHVQKKHSLQKSFNDSLEKVSVAVENLTSPRKITSPVEMSSIIPAILQTKFYSHKTHEEAVIVNRKNSNLSYQSPSSTNSSDKKVKEKSRCLADLSHETLAGAEANSFKSLQAEKNLNDPSPTGLIMAPVVYLQRLTLTSSAATEEHNLQKEKSEKYKSNLIPETTTVTKSIKESSITLQQPPHFSRTPTPVKLKSDEHGNKSSSQISAIVSSRISVTDVENHSMVELSRINEGCDIHNNKMKDSIVNSEEKINTVSHNTLQYTELKKCSVVLEDLPIPLKYLIKEAQKGGSSKEKEKENDKTTNSMERKSEQHMTQDKNLDRNKTPEKHNTEELISGNKDVEQGEMIAVSTTPLKSHISQSKPSKDTVLEPLLISSSKIPGVHSSSEKSVLQPGKILNDNSHTEISDSLSEFQDNKNRPSCKSSSATKKFASKTNELPQNVLLDADNEEPVIFQQEEPLIYQEKELPQPSNKHFTYTTVISNIKTTVLKQPRKSRHERKVDGDVTQTTEGRHLFGEKKKVKLLKGKNGRRHISDMCDLDIALNIIDEVIEEIREEVENKQELLQQIQERYQDSLHKMILKVQDIKRRDKEAKQLMATVKGLADELDKTVDKKIRLQSMLLKSKSKKATVTDGPTWEDFRC